MIFFHKWQYFPIKSIMSFFILLLVIDLNFFSQASAALNFYLNKFEAEKLFGLCDPVYYIKNGEVDDYPLKFEGVMPYSIRDLHFNWQRLTEDPISYSISLKFNQPLSAISDPLINISREGDIPNKDQVFRIDIPCNGKVEADLSFEININLTFSPLKLTFLKLPRRRICKLGVSHSIPLESNTFSSESPKEIPINNASGLLIAVVASFLSIFLFATLFYVRSHKKMSDSKPIYNGMSSQLSSSRREQSTLKLGGHINEVDTISRQESQYSACKFSDPPSPIYCAINTPIPNDDLIVPSVERRCISIDKVVFEGTYGELSRGNLIYQGAIQQVVVKTITDRASQKEASALLERGVSLFGFEHPHIQSIFATCVEDLSKPFLIYLNDSPENLKAALFRSREGLLTMVELIEISIQICEGLAFLHQKMVIHKDIAARNCVICLSYHRPLVKISDNALARDMFPGDYACLEDQESLPVKWMAPESLVNNQYNFSSDIWSFGVTIWEVITLGQQPYEDVDPCKMGAYLGSGRRLHQPQTCPDTLFKLMVPCWVCDPEERPDAAHLEKKFKDFYSEIYTFV